VVNYKFNISGLQEIINKTKSFNNIKKSIEKSTDIVAENFVKSLNERLDIGFGNWKPLSEKYLKWKENHNYDLRIWHLENTVITAIGYKNEGSGIHYELGIIKDVSGFRDVDVQEYTSYISKYRPLVMPVWNQLKFITKFKLAVQQAFFSYFNMKTEVSHERIE